MTSSKDKLIHAYDQIMRHLHSITEKPLAQRIDEAVGKTTTMSELTREEVKKVSEYVHRDIYDLAHYLHDTSEELHTWFQFDLAQVEQKTLDLMASVADQTKIELAQLSDYAYEASNYHTGEITGAGSLKCNACGQVMNFNKTGHIPPCPRCHKTQFSRLFTEDEN